MFFSCALFKLFHSFPCFSFQGGCLHDSLNSLTALRSNFNCPNILDLAGTPNPPARISYPAIHTGFIEGWLMNSRTSRFMVKPGGGKSRVPAPAWA